jgi:hypothetical protein
VQRRRRNRRKRIRGKRKKREGGVRRYVKLPRDPAPHRGLVLHAFPGSRSFNAVTPFSGFTALCKIPVSARAIHDQQANIPQEEERKAKEAYDRTKIYTGTFNVPSNLVHDPAGPKPSEIVLLAASDGKGHNGGIDNILGDVTPNRQAYADLHGYTYQFLNISQYNIGAASAVWAKLPAIVDAFNKHPEAKWIWWLDLDAIIMTPQIELSKHILSHEALGKKIQKGLDVQKPGGGSSGYLTAKEPDLNKIDIIIAQDQNGLNAGSFFIRRSEWSRMFIDMWAEPTYVEKNWLAQEQDAMVSFSHAKRHSEQSERRWRWRWPRVNVSEPASLRACDLADRQRSPKPEPGARGLGRRPRERG